MQTKDVFTSEISTQSFSKSFLEMCADNKFSNLGEILKQPVSTLLQQDTFTYHHYHELWKFLQQKGLTSKLLF